MFKSWTSLLGTVALSVAALFLVSGEAYGQRGGRGGGGRAGGGFRGSVGGFRGSAGAFRGGSMFRGGSVRPSGFARPASSFRSSNFVRPSSAFRSSGFARSGFYRPYNRYGYGFGRNGFYRPYYGYGRYGYGRYWPYYGLGYGLLGLLNYGLYYSGAYGYPGYAYGYGGYGSYAPYYGNYPYSGNNDYGYDYPSVPSVINPSSYAVPDVPDAGAQQPVDNAIHLQLLVPANAEVIFNGSKTSQTGTVREYVSPAMTPGKTYTYHITVRYMGANGKVVNDTRDVQVRANDWYSIDFTRPAPSAPPTMPPAVKGTPGR
jgi:uncharacterized protein (TIGR03000 family)